MNSVLMHLLKHEFIQQLVSLQILEDKRWKTVLMSCLYLLLACVGCVYIGGSAAGLCALGASESVMPIFVNVAMMIVLITTLMKAGHQLYASSDLELLMSMPISLRTILLSKCIPMFVTSWIVSLIILLSSSLVLAIIEGQWHLIWMSVLCSICMVLFSISAGILCSSFVFMTTSRMKHTTVLTILFLIVLILGVPFLINALGTVEQIAAFAEMMNSTVSLNPLTGLMMAALHGSWIHLFGLTAASLCVSTAVLNLISASYLRVLSSLQSTSKQEFSYHIQQSSSVTRALLIREFRHYFSSSLYVSNTIIGLILGAALVVMAWTVPLDEVLALMELPVDPAKLNLVLPVVFGMTCGMCCTSSASLSFEGKKLWLIQSLPVSETQIKISKLGMNLILNLPFVLAGSILLAVRLKSEGLILLLGLVIPVLINVFSALTGLLGNLLFQNYTWTNEVQIIKQGLSVFIGLLAPIVTSMILITSFILCEDLWYIVMICAVLSAVMLLEWKWIQYKSIEG